MSEEGSSAWRGTKSTALGDARRGMGDDPELDLMREIVKGDTDSFKKLYALYERRLFGYLIRMLDVKETAEEVLNDVMFEVWKQAGRFQARSRLSTWIFGIAHHKALNALRARRRGTTVELEEARSVVNGHARPDALLEQQNAREQLKTALSRLSPEHREVLGLTFHQALSYSEIAQITGCPVNTVKTRVFHARRQLEALLKKSQNGALS